MIAQSAFLLDNFNRLAEEAEYRHNYRNCHNRTSIAESDKSAQAYTRPRKRWFIC
jgi:hypothetical protein